MKRLGRKQPWPTSNYYPDVRLVELRDITKTSARIVSVPAEIQIRHIQHTSQKRYGLSQLAWNLALT
jgi:hypothetical protein